MKKTKIRLDIEDRMQIQACLTAAMSRAKIAFIVGCALTTISREIDRNSVRKPGQKSPVLIENLESATSVVNLIIALEKRFTTTIGMQSKKAKIVHPCLVQKVNYQMTL